MKRERERYRIYVDILYRYANYIRPCTDMRIDLKKKRKKRGRKGRKEKKKKRAVNKL